MSARTHTSRYTWQAPNQQLWPGDMSVRLTVMLKEFTSTNTQIILHIIGFTFTQNKSCSVSQSFFFFFFSFLPSTSARSCGSSQRGTVRPQLSAQDRRLFNRALQQMSDSSHLQEAFSDLSGHWTRHSTHWHLSLLQSSNYDGTAAAPVMSHFFCHRLFVTIKKQNKKHDNQLRRVSSGYNLMKTELVR